MLAWIPTGFNPPDWRPGLVDGGERCRESTRERRGAEESPAAAREIVRTLMKGDYDDGVRSIPNRDLLHRRTARELYSGRRLPKTLQRQRLRGSPAAAQLKHDGFLDRGAGHWPRPPCIYRADYFFGSNGNYWGGSHRQAAAARR